MKYKLTVRYDDLTVRYVGGYLELFTNRVYFVLLMRLLGMGVIESFTVERVKDPQEGGEG